MIENLWGILYSFSKIGFISLGGGNAMLKQIEYEFVIYRQWLGEEEFTRMVGTTFLFPGLTGVKLAALIGYKVAGLWGLALAIICLNLPGLVLAVVGYQLLNNRSTPLIQKIMIAVQYGALALLAAATFSIGQNIINFYYSLPLMFICILFFLGLVYLELSPFWGFMVFILIGAMFVRII